MTMPQLTDAHRALAQLVGHWTGEERLHPSPWAPQGATATGRVENRSALDGFVVLQDYEQSREGVPPYRGHGVFRWDPEDRSYALDWYDSMGGGPTEFRGEFLDGVLTMRAEQPHGPTRAVFDFREADTYQYRMDVSPDGTHWHPVMEGRYRRAAAGR